MSVKFIWLNSSPTFLYWFSVQTIPTLLENGYRSPLLFVWLCSIPHSLLTLLLHTYRCFSVGFIDTFNFYMVLVNCLLLYNSFVCLFFFPSQALSVGHCIASPLVRNTREFFSMLINLFLVMTFSTENSTPLHKKNTLGVVNMVLEIQH